MASTPIRLVLDFSSPGDFEDSVPSSPPLSRPNSLPNPSASVTVAAEEEETKKKTKNKKKKKSGSSSSNRIWNEEDEIAVLKGLVDYRVKTNFSTKIDWDDFYRFVRGSIVAVVSKEQVLSKIRKLRKRFVTHLEKINQGNDPLFTRSTDSEAFGFSMMLWGQNDDGDDDDDNNANLIENGEDDKAANVEPLTENETPTREIVVDKITENGTAGEESHDNDGDADEVCVVRDAFEATMSQGLREYEKKFHLEKLMNLGTGKRKELSNEWKALCVEGAELKIKKLRFSAKLAEAVVLQ